jgi:hypothetical protein
MMRFVVDVECLTRSPPVRKAYRGKRTKVLVFAHDRTDARFAAVHKMTDKWLRHRNMQTRWRARGAVTEA